MSQKESEEKNKIWQEYYKSKIEREIDNNDIKLLGQIKVSEDDYENLLIYAKGKTKYQYYADSIALPDLLMSVALVQFAIRGYDGSFWPGFFEATGTYYDSSSSNYFGRVFDSTIRAYQLMKLRNEYDKEQYVENIKAHAFVTNKYMDGFFEFADAFYENNLFRFLPDTEDEIVQDIEDLSSFMEDSLNGSSDSIRSGTHSAAKSYKLLKSTRRVFAQCDPITISSFFFPILKMVDRYFYDDYLPENEISRFAVGFSDWNKRRIDRTTAGLSEYRTRRLYSRRPYLDISYRDESVKLYIPAQRFRKTEFAGNVYVEVEINGVKEQKEVYLRDSFGTYISSSTQILIPSAFDEIKVSFNGIEEKSFIIKNRDYRIINHLWESKDKLSEGINDILIKKGTSVTFNEHCEIISKDTDYVNWDHYTIKINSESALQIGKQTLSLAGEYSKEPIFESEINNYTILDSDGNNTIATRTHPVLSFEVEKERINGTIIRINDNKISCRNIKKSVIELSDRKNICAISIDLNEVLEDRDEKYCVSYDVPGIGEKRICEYLLLSHLVCKADRELYINKEYANIHVKSKFHDVYGQDGWMAYGGENNYIIEVPITQELDEITLELDLYGDENKGYKINMPLNVFSYGFSESERIISVQKTDYHWYSDITDNLYVRNKWANSVECYYEDEKWDLLHGVQIKPGVFKVDISSIRERIYNDVEKKNHHIRVSFNGNLIKKVFIADILRSIVVEPCFKLISKDGSVFMQIEKVVGAAKPCIEVKHSFSGETVIEKKEIFLGDNCLDELSTNTPYDITLFMEEDDEFGLFAKRTDLFSRKKIQCVDIDLDDLYGTSIIIEKICYKEKKLPLKKQYFVCPIRRESKNIYQCKVQEVECTTNGLDWSTKKPLKLCRLTIEEFGDICKATFLCKSTGCDEQEQWVPYYYDIRERELVRSDNPILYNSKEYDRFLELDEDYCYILFMKRKIKKVNYAF